METQKQSYWKSQYKSWNVNYYITTDVKQCFLTKIIHDIEVLRLQRLMVLSLGSSSQVRRQAAQQMVAQSEPDTLWHRTAT